MVRQCTPGVGFSSPIEADEHGDYGIQPDIRVENRRKTIAGRVASSKQGAGLLKEIGQKGPVAEGSSVRGAQALQPAQNFAKAPSP
jgi:hypothetical protein